ncbi:phosphoribosylglycinamide formyltransferase [Patescibacteria group bacterium]|nr:phosphoribosylglycinamide formyltransferase [Patescibacteria group bacterium]
MKKIRLAVLIGRGGRLPAIYKCCKKDPLVNLALVVSHKKESPGIEKAKKWGIEAFYFRFSDWQNQGKSREDYNRELARILKERKIDLIVMAGWDLVMDKNFLSQFPNKVINIHPSLCPAFPGLDSEKQALDYGVKITGCTLHFVDEGVDTGPIIFQEAVEIKPNDTSETLQKKIHKKEEKILCKAIKLFARNKIKVEGRKVWIL